jgi:hypothetical protein
MARSRDMLAIALQRANGERARWGVNRIDQDQEYEQDQHQNQKIGWFGVCSVHPCRNTGEGEAGLSNPRNPRLDSSEGRLRAR